MNEKILTVVLGMHRSGTSVITRSLHVLGGDTGNNLMEPWIDNPKGYWEDKSIVDLNNEMLDFLGMDWSHLRRLDKSDIIYLEEAGFLAKAEKLINSRLDKFSSFVVKDPRIAGLIKFWQGVWERGNYRTDFVLAIRNPYSVVNSLVKRNEMPPVQGVLLWLGHTLELLSGSAGFTRVIIDYDRLLGNPEQELRRVADGLSREVEKNELSVFINEFIDLTLRHELIVNDNPDETDEMFCLASEVYQALLQSIDEERALDGEWLLHKLDDWEQRFRQFSNVLEGVDSMQCELKKQSADIYSMEGTIESMQQTIDSMESTQRSEVARIKYLEDQLYRSNKDMEYAQNLVYKRDVELKEESIKRLKAEERYLQLEVHLQKEKEESQQYFTKILQAEKEKTRRYNIEHTAEIVSNIFSLAEKEQKSPVFPFSLFRRRQLYKKRFNLQIF